MDFGIAGRTALVCGASRGLGKACAMALAQEGVNLTIVARTRDVLERTGAEIAQATGVKVTAVAADLTTPDGRAAAIDACAAPDILVNNSQGPLPGDFHLTLGNARVNVPVIYSLCASAGLALFLSMMKR